MGQDTGGITFERNNSRQGCVGGIEGEGDICGTPFEGSKDQGCIGAIWGNSRGKVRDSRNIDCAGGGLAVDFGVVGVKGAGSD